MATTKCAACGCPIEFIEGPNGKAIPVQRVRTVYVRISYASARADSLRKIDLSDHGGAYWVSHFETCSDPGRFSRKR